MPFSIALAGKGGTGKTTLAGMLIKYLVGKGKTPVLAIDADSNANLNDVLGLEVVYTLGNAREEMKNGNVPVGMSKNVFMSMKLERAIVEAHGYDLLVMGQPEGAGCYCAANNLLAGFMDRLSDNYPYIVMDNEAGMEHISRLTTKNVDLLLVVSDTSRRGLQTASRIDKLAKNLSAVSGKSYLVLNRASEALPDPTRNMIKNKGLELVGIIPEDSAVYEFDLNGRPTIELPHDNQAVKAAFMIFDTIIN
ncbi:MAG: AAA family ATPase [Desulfobacteraceae bacterium]|nr:AAA family ATPase [Pseudomonadota bacterium]MBU4462858.1 AAA family ATPase [Pseudomonadota bacterium]MCG2755864.1 AAA family ATPase [Desulfobacteraceae bacterium]